VPWRMGHPFMTCGMCSSRTQNKKEGKEKLKKGNAHGRKALTPLDHRGEGRSMRFPTKQGMEKKERGEEEGGPVKRHGPLIGNGN